MTDRIAAALCWLVSPALGALLVFGMWWPVAAWGAAWGLLCLANFLRTELAPEQSKPSESLTHTLAALDAMSERAGVYTGPERRSYRAMRKVA